MKPIQRIPQQQIGIGRLVWTPKWRWFKPPKWRIFRWAYRYTVVNNNRRVYTNETFAQAIRDFENNRQKDGSYADEMKHPED